MDNTDVELNALLGIDSSDNTTDASSSENSENEATPSPVEAEAEPKITEREQDRARKLSNRVRELEQELAKQKTTPDFYSNIQDEGTRNLLMEQEKHIRSQIEREYSPVLSTFKEDRFEKEFSQYVEKLPNLIHHKEELKKEFTRNSESNLKSMVGTLAMEILTSKIKPLESKTSQSPRDEVVANLDVASKEDLYAMLKAKKN